MENKDFKIAVTRAGLCFAVIFICRAVCDILALFMSKLAENLDAQLVSGIATVLNILILYGGGIFATMKIMDIHFSDILPLYTKTKRLGKAVSWAVPCYGASQIVSITVIAISFLVAGNQHAVSDTFSPITSNGEGGSTVLQAMLLVFQLSIMAPVLEEFWFRGVIQTGLSKFGNGYAIVVSAILFGIAHGNVHQFSYATMMGILVGYVRYASGSLLATTIIHAIINSIAAILLVIISSEPVVNGMNHMQEGIPMTGTEKGMIALLTTYTIVVLIFMIIGMVSAINKLKNNKLYRPIQNYTELTKAEKFKGTITNPTFVICLALCIAYMIAQIFI